MKATTPNFKPTLNTKNIKIIIGLLILLVGILVFGLFRDTDTLITHKQANALFTQNKITKIIVDGEYIRIQTPDSRYKIYKDAINQEAFFSKYLVEVVEDKGYIYDILSLLLLLGIVWFMIYIMKQNRLQQLKYIRQTNGAAQNIINEPVKALTSHVTF
ncbi:MAG: ATP-dependent metallopeptidase FtsH/Yme1/Tma family protein, partial [Sulfurovum sp.]